VVIWRIRAESLSQGLGCPVAVCHRTSWVWLWPKELQQQSRWGLPFNHSSGMVWTSAFPFIADLLELMSAYWTDRNLCVFVAVVCVVFFWYFQFHFTPILYFQSIRPPKNVSGASIWHETYWGLGHPWSPKKEHDWLFAHVILSNVQVASILDSCKTKTMPPNTTPTKTANANNTLA